MFRPLSLTFIIFGIFIDQWTKILANRHLSPVDQIVMIPGKLSLVLVHNYGAAYGFLQHQRVFLVVTSFLIICGCIYFRNFLAQTRLAQTGLGFLLVGSIGNFIDRVVCGYVTDFIYTPWFPVFNIADICIDIGIGCMILDLIIHRDQSTA